MHGVAVDLCGEVHRLETKLHDSSDTAAEGHIPHVIVATPPVGSDDGRSFEVPALLHVVVNEPLQEKLIHRGFIAIRMAGYRPVVIDESPDRKMWGLDQRHHRGPDAELSLPEIGRISSRRCHQGRADTPYYLDRKSVAEGKSVGRG